MNLAPFVFTFAALAASQALAQQSSAQPTGQQDPQQPARPTQSKRPLKPNEVDPNGKLTDLPDPTKDPSKDPSTDLTKDPSKDPDATAQSGDKNAGADSEGVVEAPDYTGPAILSRGYALSRPSIPLNEPFRVYVGVNATYDSGLSGAYIQNGVVPTVSTLGADFNWGASVRHYRRRSIVDMNYNGHYYEYSSDSKFSGQDHSLSAGYTQQISPRITIGVRENAGLYSNTYSVLNSTALQDVSLASSTIVVAPNTEAFNDRAYYSTTTGSATYQFSPRLSFSVSGAYFLVNRNSQFLANTRGYQANGDIAYRITKRQTAGIYYAHSEFSYTKIFGDSNADSVGGIYSISLDKFTDLSVRAGVTRYDSQTLDSVTPNPLVQAVLGIQSGVEKSYFVGYAPDLTVTLTRNLRHSSIGASFTEGITPGNGLVLTSKRQSESAFWNLPTFRKYATQAGAGRDNLSGYASGLGADGTSTGTPAGFTAGSYASYYARLTVTRPVTRIVSSYFNIDYRQYGFSGTTFHQKEYRISLGLRFSPGEGPIKFW